MSVNERLMSDLDKFWELIELKMGCNVPKYIRNILALNGYENAVSIVTLKSEDISFLQNYARKDMKKRIPSTANLNDYYGYFSDEPTEFVFLRGHVKLLEGIVEFIRSETRLKGIDCFSVKSSNKVNGLKSTFKSNITYLSKMTERAKLCKKSSPEPSSM